MLEKSFNISITFFYIIWAKLSKSVKKFQLNVLFFSASDMEEGEYIVH